jgi:hypothetical protein
MEPNGMEHNGLFAEINDSIRKLASKESGTRRWEFICECPRNTCHALVTLSLSEFDERRAAAPPVPILAAEHSG